MKGNVAVLVVLCIIIVGILIYYFGFNGLDLSVLQ